MSNKALGDHHIFLDFWLTPWSWYRPWVRFDRKTWEFDICFVFGKIEMIVD